MSVTIFYTGNLKNPDNIPNFFAAASEVADKFKWSYMDTGTALSISVPNCETILFQPKNGKISGFSKYWGESQDMPEQLFELFREIKPYFKRLKVDDDFGLWHQYISQFSKERMPHFRELKDIEKEELSRGFDLPKDSTSIFGMNEAEAVLMFMICKDMGNDLSKPLLLENLLALVDSRCGTLLTLDANNNCFQFIAIAETWFLTKLKNKHGESTMTEERTKGFTLFGWLMAEIIFGFGGGSLGGKHQKLHRFVDSLLAQNVDFGNPENFLRLTYSVIEYLGGFRPDASIAIPQQCLRTNNF